MDIRASDLDRPSVLNRLFYPRQEEGPAVPPGREWFIPVDDEVTLGARYFPGTVGRPMILYFHGNGEIAADYVDVGPLLAERAGGFLVVDYRGYGRSEGNPTVSTLLADSHRVLEHVRRWLPGSGLSQRLLVMGRSLGSAPAVELAAARGEVEVAGLIVESGFARVEPLLRTLGVAERDISRADSEILDNERKIRRYGGPTLIIHGARDHLIPVENGEALYEASASAEKQLLIVPNADHNSLFHHGLENYLAAVGHVVEQVVAAG